MKKLKWKKCKNSDGNALYASFKVPLGNVHLYIIEESNGKWSYSGIWTDNNGSGTRIVLSKKNKYEISKEVAIEVCLEKTLDWFLDSKVRSDYNKTIEIINDLCSYDYDVVDSFQPPKQTKSLKKLGYARG